jgi:HSP20 family molecular chaperone IbpA
MADNQELQVQKKQEADKPHESTTPTRAFIPTADIFETEEGLTVVLEMPGVSRNNIGRDRGEWCPHNRGQDRLQEV